MCGPDRIKAKKKKHKLFITNIIHASAFSRLEVYSNGKRECERERKSLTKHLKLHVYISYSWQLELLAHSHIRYGINKNGALSVLFLT